MILQKQDTFDLIFAGDLVFALSVDRSSAGSHCDTVADECNWTIMPCRDVCLFHSNANSNNIWPPVLHSEVCI